VPAPVFAPAPAPVFAPAPAPVFAPAPIVEEKKEEIKVIETVTAKVALPPITIIETPAEPTELTTQNRKERVVEPVVEKILTKIAVPKLPTFKGAGPFRFALGLSEQGSSAAIKDPDLAIGLKVISQTPTVCKVATTFNKTTGKYSISVVGLSNGQCRITAVDKGNDEKFPTATEIKQTITGVTTRKTVTAKATKPTPAPKVGIKKASYKP
jgi:hypothetical protein